MLVLLASPLVALPPVVLPVTLAEPLLADWLLVLVTVTVLVLVVCELSVQWLLTLLSLLGPVVLMVPVRGDGVMAALLLALLLLAVALALTVLLLLAEPEPASPPVVLPDTVTVPVLEPWPLLTVPVIVLVLVRRLLLVTRECTWLLLVGPVLLILPVSAATTPVVRLKPRTVAAAAR